MKHGEGSRRSDEDAQPASLTFPKLSERGAAALGDYVVEEEVQWIPIHIVDTSPFQARLDFDDEAVRDLAASIKVHGVLQPLIVRPKGSRVELVVGERRFRACQLLGWTRIPAVVRDLDDRHAAEMVMIENLQRRDLNPIEEARGYERMLTTFSLTQQQLAERLGLSQSAIANKLRLLRLPEEVRELVSAGKLSERHARALLRLEDEERQVAWARWAVEKEATVRELERRLKEEEKRQGAAEQEEGADKQGGTAGHEWSADVLLSGLDKLVNRWKTAGVAVAVDVEDGADAVEVRLRIPKNVER